MNEGNNIFSAPSLHTNISKIVKKNDIISKIVKKNNIISKIVKKKQQLMLLLSFRG